MTSNRTVQGVLGTKLGMTQVFDASGRVVPVTVVKAGPTDSYGDISVDTNASHRLYLEWMAKTRPAPGPDGTRRPMWFDRPLRPIPDAYKIK